MNGKNLTAIGISLLLIVPLVPGASAEEEALQSTGKSENEVCGADTSLLPPAAGCIHAAMDTLEPTCSPLEGGDEPLNLCMVIIWVDYEFLGVGNACGSLGHNQTSEPLVEVCDGGAHLSRLNFMFWVFTVPEGGRMIDLGGVLCFFAEGSRERTCTTWHHTSFFAPGPEELPE